MRNWCVPTRFDGSASLFESDHLCKHAVSRALAKHIDRSEQPETFRACHNHFASAWHGLGLRPQDRERGAKLSRLRSCAEQTRPETRS